MSTAGARPLLVALRALGLGDLLVAVPALRALGRTFPDHERVLLAPRFLAPLLPLIHDDWSLIHLDAKDGFESSLGSGTTRPVELAVNLHGRGPQSHALLRGMAPDRLLAFAPPGDAGARGDAPAWHDDEHEVRRWCRLLSAYGVPASPDELDLHVPDEWRAAHGGPDVTVVHVGAAGPSRRWPLARWALVADAERRAGRRVVLTGSAAERPDALVVARWAGLPEDTVVAGRTDLSQLVELLAGAARLVSTDTGVAHLATALRVPSVVLFGPTSPARWGPPRDRWWHVPLWAGREGDPFAADPDPGLLRLGAEDVLAALIDLPDRAQVPGALVSPSRRVSC